MIVATIAKELTTIPNIRNLLIDLYLDCITPKYRHTPNVIIATNIIIDDIIKHELFYYYVYWLVCYYCLQLILNSVYNYI